MQLRRPQLCQKGSELLLLPSPVLSNGLCHIFCMLVAGLRCNCLDSGMMRTYCIAAVICLSHSYAVYICNGVLPSRRTDNSGAGQHTCLIHTTTMTVKFIHAGNGTPPHTHQCPLNDAVDLGTHCGLRQRCRKVRQCTVCQRRLRWLPQWGSVCGMGTAAGAFSCSHTGSGQGLGVEV